MVLKWLMSCRLVLSLFFCCTPTCHSWRPCSGLWQQIMKRICRRCCGRYDWRDLCHSLQIALQSVTFAKGGQGGRLGRPFIRKWRSSLWWAPSPRLFFIFVTRPVNAPHSACAQVAYELTWNEQSKRDQSRWYSSTWAFSFRMSAR